MVKTFAEYKPPKQHANVNGEFTTSAEEKPYKKTVLEFITQINKLLCEDQPLKAAEKLFECMEVHKNPLNHNEKISELGAKIISHLDTILLPEELEELRERMRRYSISQTENVARKYSRPTAEAA